MTLDQKRASRAYQDVHAIAKEHVKNSQERQQYGTLAQKLPILIRSAGLCQALYFLQSRAKNQKVVEELLTHLAGQLNRADPKILDASSLLDRVRASDLQAYLWLTREALAVAEWYARLSQCELEVVRGSEENRP